MKAIIIGAGGQARVVFDILCYDKNIEVVAFIDNVKRGANEKIMNVPVMGDHSVIHKLIDNGIKWAIIGIGDNNIRATYFNNLKKIGLELMKAIHPTVHLGHHTKIGEGTVIVTGATIATGVEIGKNVIINTGAIIEHENILEDHVHIAPGVVLAGRVTVHEKAFIGAGSIVKEYVTIGKNVTVGAGSIVLNDLPDNTVAFGAPAKIVSDKKNCSKNKKGLPVAKI